MRYIDTYLENLEELTKLKEIIGKKLETLKKNMKTKENVDIMTSILLFEKIKITADSILKISPYSIYDREKNYIWDLSSVAVLSRNIIENYNMVFYLVLEKIDSSEKKFREMLCELHSLVEKIKMYFNLEVDQEIIELQQDKIDSLRKKIKENKFYKSLHFEKKKEILRGKQIFYFPKHILYKKIDVGIGSKNMEFLYRFTSNYVHTSPFAIEDTMSDQETEVIYISELIWAVNAYLKKVEKDIKELK